MQSQERPVMGQIVPFPDRFDSSGNRWEPWLNEKQIAQHFGVHVRTVRNWRKAGMPSLSLGAARRYRLTDCEAWHERRAS